MSTKENSATGKLRVLSYNIHQGLTIHRRKIATKVLKDAIKSLGAQVVLLQEVAGTTGHAGKNGLMSVTQLEDLADAIWPYHAYQKNAIFAGGFHGNAILSAHPIVNWEYIDLTVPPLDKRGLLHGEIELPGKIRAHVLAVHLGLLQYERRRQLKKICDYIRSRIPSDAPCFLGGDFNDWRQQATDGLMARVKMDEAFFATHEEHAKTFPSRMPMLRLDRIYFKNARIQRARCLKGQPWFFLSDHLPIAADFSIEKD